MTNEEETNLENEAIFILDRMNVKELKELLKKHKAKDKGIAELRKQVEELEEIRQLLNGASLHPNITGVSVYDDVKDKIAEQAEEIERLKEENKLYKGESKAHFDCVMFNSEIQSENTRLKEELNSLTRTYDYQVRRNGMLSQRPDLPVDRLPATEKYEAEINQLKELVGVYEEELEIVKKKRTFEGNDPKKLFNMACDVLDFLAKRAKTALAKGQQMKEGMRDDS